MPDLSTMQTLINAVGWMLIHFLWQGCVIAGLYWMVLKSSGQSSSETRYGWGLLACLAVVVVPLVTLATLLDGAANTWKPAVEELPVITVLANGYAAGGGRWLQLALEPALPVVVGLWALGVALLSLRTLLGWWGARRLVRVGVDAVNTDLQDALGRLQALMGVRRAVLLLRSVRVRVPTVIGWIRPVILLPASVITSLPREQLEMVIAHELAHVQRWDYLVNLLQLVIETLFFYHPAVRWISRQVRQEREHCCDDLVVARCGQPVAYARALTRLETLRGHACSPALAATGGDLFTRVSRIVQREAPRANSGVAQVSLVTALALVAGLGAGKGLDTSFRYLAGSTPATAHTSQAGDTIAALGEGWSRHLGRWSPPEAGSRNLRQEPVTPRRAPAAGTKKATPIQETGADAVIVQRNPLLPPRTPALPDLASLSPRTMTLRREDVTVERPETPITGQVSVVPLFTVDPRYPDEALQQGIGGQVRLRFRVDGRGKALDIEVARSQPAGVFDAAAIAALQQWTFQVNAGHDPEVLLAQAFDFSWEEVVEPSTTRRLHAKDCIRTGTRVCSKPYTDEYIVQFRPRVETSPGSN